MLTSWHLNGQETTLPIPPPKMSCVMCIFTVVDAATISMRPKFTSSSK